MTGQPACRTMEMNGGSSAAYLTRSLPLYGGTSPGHIRRPNYADFAAPMSLTLCAMHRTLLMAGKNNKLNFLWPKMACLGPFFLTPKSTPKKFMWVPFLGPFPGNEAHKLFSGGPKWGVLGGGQKV